MKAYKRQETYIWITQHQLELLIHYEFSLPVGQRKGMFKRIFFKKTINRQAIKNSRLAMINNELSLPEILDITFRSSENLIKWEI